MPGMARLRLISTDFDGTLIGFSGEQDACVPLLKEVLLEAKAQGALWVINTGRSLEFTLQGLVDFQGPFAPDFLIVNERHLFRREGQEWISMEPWNAECDAVHERLFFRTEGLLEALRNWADVTSGVQLLPDSQCPQGLVTRDEQTMDAVATFLDSLSLRFADFSYQRNAIYLRFSHRSYSKGAALRHLRDELGLSVEEVLAAGDNHNDLSMLESTVAGMRTCPANAIAEVRAAVAEGGGYVAHSYFGEGTAEGVRYFLERKP